MGRGPPVKVLKDERVQRCDAVVSVSAPTFCQVGRTSGGINKKHSVLASYISDGINIVTNHDTGTCQDSILNIQSGVDPVVRMGALRQISRVV